MSLRGVWILTTPSAGSGNIESRLLFSRIYQTVEKKMHVIHGEDFVPLPPNQELVTSLLYELGYSVSSKFATVRDTCTKVEEKPVVEIETSVGKHWPVVIVEQPGLLYCCIPSVETCIAGGKRPPLIKIPGVTLGFSLLCVLADYLRSLTSTEILHRIFDIYSFLSHAAPFGKPVDVNLESVLAKMANKISPVPKSQRQPAWKPVLHKGKNQIHLVITEYIRAIQYDKKDTEDVWDLYGTVSCKAELVGAMPDITLNISHSPDGNTLPLDHLIIHPCVQSADTAIIETGKEVRPSPRRLRFTPPAEYFTLCHYTVSSLKDLPVRGSYEVKGDNKSLILNAKLKLDERVRNSFEYCELQMPFFNRGPVINFESTPNHGSVMLSPDKRVFVWNIGAKFPSRSLEVHLSANLQFGDALKPATTYDESFCVGLNTYAQLYFKITEFTHSGCLVDPKSVQVSPYAKLKLTTVREYLSTGYRIWNSQGDVLTSSPPTQLLKDVT
ncbi:hypothetical protein ScPMuIL_013670 [Solemya velum]